MGHRQKKTQPTTQPFPTLSKTKKNNKKKKNTFGLCINFDYMRHFAEFYKTETL